MDLVRTLFGWMNDQLLKMLWLNDAVGWLVEDVIGLSGRTAGAVQFFIYDVIKIFILLGTLIFAISYVQSYFSPARTRAILGRFSGVGANTVGALLGTVTPFCSCSSIPLFIGFTKAGLPLGVTFSFLISSPLVDMASIILLASIFNWKIAFAYVLTGLVLAVVGGTLISALKMERHVEEFVYAARFAEHELPEPSQRERLVIAWEAVVTIVKRVWPYVLVGVGIGALIHGWIPAEFLNVVLGERNPFSVIIATLVGVPVYSDIFATLPIAQALVGKGVQIGTVLAFTMAVTALSLPSLIMLKKVVKTPLLAAFFGIVVVGIFVIGYAFNAFGMLLV